MSHPMPLRTNDLTTLLLAIFATLARAPANTDTSFGRHALVLRMLRRGTTASLSDDTLIALTDELLAIATRFPTFDALLASYDTVVAAATTVTLGLETALAGEVKGVPFLAGEAASLWPHTDIQAM